MVMSVFRLIFNLVRHASFIKGVTKEILDEVTMIKEETVHSNFIFPIIKR